MLTAARRLSLAARRLSGDRQGSTAIEYGLIAALVCIAMLVGLTGTNGSVTETWGGVMDRVVEALSNGA